MSIPQFTGRGGPGLYLPPFLTAANMNGRFDPIHISNGAGIQPFCFPWTPTVDLFGVAYPANTVGVWDIYSAPGSGSYQSRWETYRDANMIPVPGILPVGYTARREHDHLMKVNSTLGMGCATCDFVHQEYSRYLGPSGPISYLWTPVHRTYANGHVYLPTPRVSGFYQVMNGATATGWREITYQWTMGGHDYDDLKGRVDLTISHNADGSDPGFAAGDTLDHTSTGWESGDMVWNAGNNRWESNEFTTGPILPTLGTLSYYVIGVTFGAGVDTVGTHIGNGGPSLKFSPRVDVPFRWTCSGEGDLIAPGGLVT